ncbi:MAG: hypothetical protein ACR2IE_08520 [Candidatus Sumerlaeaceae bacterium]
MTAKFLIYLVLLCTLAAFCLGGCSIAGSCLQGTGKVFNSMGNSVKSL